MQTNETISQSICSVILRELLKVLVQIHGTGIFHGNLNDEYVIVSEGAHVKLKGFLFYALNPKPSRRLGNALFHAPDYLKGRSADFADDVWSLGILAIKMATGKTPHENFQGNYSAFARRVVLGASPSLSIEFSTNFQDFVASCLIKNPDLRPSCAQLLMHPFIEEYSLLPASQINDILK